MPWTEHFSLDQRTAIVSIKIGEKIIFHHIVLDHFDCLFESWNCLLGWSDDVARNCLRDIMIECSEHHISEYCIIKTLLSCDDVGEEGDDIGMREDRDRILAN